MSAHWSNEQVSQKEWIENIPVLCSLFRRYGGMTGTVFTTINFIFKDLREKGVIQESALLIRWI